MSATRKWYTGLSQRYANRLVITGLTAGAASGIVLAFTMHLLERLTGSGVYVLLLNIDFIKLPFQPSELLEFSLHLAVSLPLGIIYLSLLPIWRTPIKLCLGMSLAIACCTWIPLTQLSERTPETGDVEALVWWLIGHLLYGAVLSIFGISWMKKGMLDK